MVVQALPFKTLVIIQRESVVPVYQQIANQLVSMIRRGLLRPGSALPSSREMAGLLRVHRKTVIAAYDELIAQDWTEAVPRKGIYVSTHLPETKADPFKQDSKNSGYYHDAAFSFHRTGFPTSQTEKASGHRLIINDGFPDPRIAPVDLLLREYRRLNKRKAIQRLVVFGRAEGSGNLRESLSRFLAQTRGLNITANNILLTHGAQMAIFIAAGLILRRGSVVVVAEPNYFMANRIFQQYGAELIRILVDGNGIDVDEVEKVCKKKKPDLLYIIPHHHHPTTVTLSADRRMKLLQLVNKYKLPVIEDDYDFDFHYSRSPILPLASADHNGNVIYIGSLTKTLTTSLRMGYMVAPENFIREAALRRTMMDFRGDQILEEAMAFLFMEGTMQRHLKKSVKLYRERRDLFCDLLKSELGDAISFEKPAGGMAVWVKFKRKFPLPSIARTISAQGLYISDGRFYNSGNVNYNALRMGFASLNEKEMREAVEILKNDMEKRTTKSRRSVL